MHLIFLYIFTEYYFLLIPPLLNLQNNTKLWEHSLWLPLGEIDGYSPVDSGYPKASIHFWGLLYVFRNAPTYSNSV